MDYLKKPKVENSGIPRLFIWSQCFLFKMGL